ncbi:YdcF family protein [Deinococcus aquaticus]|uniref:YdcF family protein n=1 Tax=Deinococcus aquaticus TaxID=328692 RepID=UPI003F47CBC4
MTAPDRTEQIRGALGGAAVGAALGVLAAFLGEVRTTTPLLWTLLILGALAGAFCPSRRALHATATGVALALAACLLTPALRAPLAALTLDQPPGRADAIVVLGGGLQCQSRTLESASLARLTRGLELWGQDYAPTLTVSEQSGLIGPRDCPKISTLERRIITRQLGTDGPEVLTLSNVTTTRDEAARVHALARTRGWTTVLLVTSPSHSRRAAALMRTPDLRVISVPAPETRFDTTLPLPLDRLWAVRILAYESLSRVKAALGGTPER